MLSIPNQKEFTDLYLNSQVKRSTIAAKYYVSEGTIDIWAKGFGITRKGNKLKKEDLQGCLDCSLTLKQIAEQLNCTGITVTTYLKMFNLKSKFKKEVNLDVDELYRLRVVEKWNYGELAELYKASDATVRRKCEEFEFPRIKVDVQDDRWWKKETVIKVKTDKRKKEWRLKPIITRRKVNENASKKLAELYAIL